MAKIGALLVKPALRKLKKRLDVTEYGGAPILGLSKPVIKAHGSSGAQAIASAIRRGEAFVRSGATEIIREAADNP